MSDDASPSNAREHQLGAGGSLDAPADRPHMGITEVVSSAGFPIDPAGHPFVDAESDGGVNWGVKYRATVLMGRATPAA